MLSIKDENFDIVAEISTKRTELKYLSGTSQNNRNFDKYFLCVCLSLSMTCHHYNATLCLLLLLFSLMSFYVFNYLL